MDGPTRRELQAAQTRADIVEAARRLFTAQGYAATSVRDVAKAANVSLQTVYDSVGPKPDLLVAVSDSLEVAAEIPRLVGAAMASGDPEDLVRLPARIAVSILVNAGDITRLMVHAAPVEEVAAKVLAAGRVDHDQGVAGIVGAWAERGLLARGVDLGEAVDTMRVLCDPAYLLLLHDTYGWSPERIETWITDQARASLLA